MERISRFINLLPRKRKKQPDDGARGDGGASSSAGAATHPIPTSTTAAPASRAAKTSPATTTTTTTQPPPEHSTPSVPRPPGPGPTSLASARPCAQPTDADTVASPASDDTYPWARAYEIVQERECELMADYRKHLGSLQDDAAAGADLSTRRSVESIVNALLEDREKRQWRVSLLGNDVKIREQAEKLTKFLLWTDPIVKSAVSAQPHAALAWSGVSLVLPLLTSATTQNEAMLKGFNSIGDLHLFWHICEETHLQSDHRPEYQHLIEPLAKLYSYLIEYQARVICHLSRAQLSRAWQDMAGSSDWAGKIREIDGVDKGCRDIVGVSQAEEIRKNRDNQLREMQKSRITQEDTLQTIKEHIQDEKETRLLRDLAVAAGDYERYKDINRERVPGTCEWFLTDERFCEWRDSGSSRLLWASAGPGRGKSVLSRSLIDEGQLSTITTTITIISSAISASTGTRSTVCYFFFKDGGDGRMDGPHALCAILHQLFKSPSTAGLIKHALPIHKDNGETLTQKFSDLWRILEACARSPDAGEIVCILDALDECKEDSRPEIIKTLERFYSPSEKLSNLPSKLKFLVTSRPYEDLEKSFKKFPATAAYLHFDGDDKSEQIAREIDLVIDARVPDITTGFDADDQRKISERLKSIEHRTYLWLHLTFDIIERGPSKYGRRVDIEELMSDLPSEVFDAYEKILKRSTDQPRAEILLQIVLAAARPLTLDEANHALAIAVQKEQFTSHAALRDKLWPDDNFQSTVKNLCGLFITVHGSKLSFIHQTAREFLIHPKRQGKWQGRLTMSKSHGPISRSCLHYLLLPDIDRPVGDSPANDKQHPFLAYASAHWPLHYASQETDAADQSRQSARMLCNTVGHQADIWAPRYFRQRYMQWNGRTDLALASYLGLKPVVENILREENTHVDAQGGEYGTALQAASAQGHKEIVQMLLDRGADIEAKDGDGWTPLSYAVQEGHEAIVRLLLEKDADPNCMALFGEWDSECTVLSCAAGNGDEAIVRLLLEKGADIEAKNKDGQTALSWAAENGHEAIVGLLLDKGADINFKGGFYGTALQAASMQGHKEIVQMLLDKDADVNAQGGYYGTALQAASARGHKGIVQILKTNQYKGTGRRVLEQVLA